MHSTPCSPVQAGARCIPCRGRARGTGAAALRCAARLQGGKEGGEGVQAAWHGVGASPTGNTHPNGFLSRWASQQLAGCGPHAGAAQHLGEKRGVQRGAAGENALQRTGCKGIVRDRAGANPLRASWWAQCCHKQRDGSKACCVCCWEWDGSKALWWVQSHHKQCNGCKSTACVMVWVQMHNATGWMQWDGCSTVGANSQAMGWVQTHCTRRGGCK